ncbi:MAG: hypothetical protein LBR38_05270 [Synergistaceae bacterium]|nr:hypothetical protein [Synergistaceae bacterium]
MDNPFRILGATPHDDRRRIMELAEEAALSRDPDECAEARSVLTNPRKRLAAEMSWLPGVDPGRAAALASWFDKTSGINGRRFTGSYALYLDSNMTPIAQANVFAAEIRHACYASPEELSRSIRDLAVAFDEIDAEDIAYVINDDRAEAEFPEVPDLSAVESEIRERRRYYLDTIKSALDTLPTEELVAALTSIVKSATNDGTDICPYVISDLVDLYEAKAQTFFDREMKYAIKIAEQIQNKAKWKQSNNDIIPHINELFRVVRNWKYVARPIELHAKAAGRDYTMDSQIFRLVRSIGVDMCNRYRNAFLSRMLLGSLHELFPDAEGLAKDLETLDEIINKTASIY